MTWEGFIKHVQKENENIDEIDLGLIKKYCKKGVLGKMIFCYNFNKTHHRIVKLNN